MSGPLILMYHVVDRPLSEAEKRFCVTPEAFSAQMDALIHMGRRPIALPELVTMLKQGKPVPSASVAITFDDGFECFQRNALPVLRSRGIPSTLFAVAGLIGQTNTWMQKKGWPERRLMDATELRDVRSAGVTIGCHAYRHVKLPECSDGELVTETAGARARLSEVIGDEVDLFAFPHGAQGARERDAVSQAGFRAACSTVPGFVQREANLYSLCRIDVYGSDSVGHFRRKVQFGTNRFSGLDLARYYAKRLYSKING